MIYTSAAINQRRQRSVDAETYDNFVEAISRIPAVRSGEVSILVHGSYAKQDLAPGWSDVDLVVLYRNVADRQMVEFRINAYAHACDLLVRPVFAQFDSFVEKKAVHGFPQAALIDALSAGYFISGDEKVAEILPCDVDMLQLQDEAGRRTSFALDHWVKKIRPDFRVNPASFVMDSAKTALQLLMYSESSLWANDRTRSGYLESYKERSNIRVELFEEALLVRTYWYEYTKGSRMNAAQDLLFCWMMMLVDTDEAGLRDKAHATNDSSAHHRL